MSVALVAFVGFCTTTNGAVIPAERLDPIDVDHHLHVNSPAILRIIPNLCHSPTMPVPCPPEFEAPYTLKDLFTAMDAAGVKRGVLLSTGYIAETSFIQPMVTGHAEILHAGNAFTEAAARANPKRLVAFIGVNPLTATALPEITSWKGDRFVAGVKLHLTNSGVDLRNPSDVGQLATIFRTAAESHFAIVIHMRTMRKDYGAEDVRIFVRDILPQAQQSIVQIAHAGGWGGLDTNTLEALGAFAAAIDAHPELRKHLFFDLAAVWDDKTTPTQKRQLVALIRRIGIRQFLPGSDWPFRFDLATYYSKTYPELPLTETEWKIIRSNVAPYFPLPVSARRRE